MITQRIIAGSILDTIHQHPESYLGGNLDSKTFSDMIAKIIFEYVIIVNGNWWKSVKYILKGQVCFDPIYIGSVLKRIKRALNAC